jgi:PAS domain S-box-containing protein
MKKRFARYTPLRSVFLFFLLFSGPALFGQVPKNQTASPMVVSLIILLAGIGFGSLLFAVLLKRSIRCIRLELAEKSEKYTALVNNTGLIVLLIDPENAEILDANPAALEFYGYTYEELTAKTVFDLNIDDRAHVHQRIRAASESRNSNMHVRHRLASGEIRNVELFVGPIVTGGKRCNFAFVIDETDKIDTLQRLADEKERSETALKIKNDFLANISHELRTPLNGIIGMLSILENLELQHEERYFLSLAQESSQQLFEVIRDLLDFSQLDSGAMGLKNEVFDLSEALRMGAGLLAAQAKEKGLEIETSIHFTYPWYLGDKSRILQIIINLLSNAVKYSDSGTIRLEAEDRDGLLIRISDEGIGIPESQQEEIFSSFHQLESPYNKRVRGIGLGLAIVTELLKLMDGTISVESKEGRGSCFSVHLPDNFQQKAMERPVPAEPATTRGEIGGKILIVEDEAINRIYLSKMLSSHGFSIVEATDGHQAVERCLSESPDLVLMDISLPRLNGLEATREIHGIGKYRNLPIIALTAHAHADDIETFLSAGMSRVITKPVKEASLLESLSEYLKVSDQDF